MRVTETSFDPNRHHIHLELVVNNNGIEYSVDAILDTGAPHTEFSDQFLVFTGFIDTKDESKKIPPGLQTQKYEKIILPFVKICNHELSNYEVYVSSFDDAWGIDALIGLDFFRKFVVTIDYDKGVLIVKDMKK